MNSKLMDCFTNPVMCKLFLEIRAKGAVTAKQLADTYQDIAITTLYRYLKRMMNDGLLKIVSETQIRGTVEKTYAVTLDLEADIQEIIESNNGEAYMMLFMQYISGFIKSFQAYCKRDDINIMKDISSFTTVPIYVTNEEMIAALTKMGEIVAELYANKPGDGRKLRNLGVIITPPEEISG